MSANQQRLGRGRPKIPDKQRRSCQINVALTEAQMRWLKSRADVSDCGINAIVRSLIDQLRVARTR
jgi:hypothetical protein